MTIRNTYAAESWDKVYNAFQQINFTSYDYDTVKESLLQYLKIYHAEHFNDFIESSELIAMLELFAYVAELLAYRVDTMSHENFITTAQRKQSILKLARLISYSASRNIPARGLVKINNVRTSEDVYDSLGNNLANITIAWNDPNNTNWKEQFFLVMGKSLTTRFGQPSKSFQVGDVLMQLYTFNNKLAAFRNGVYSFSASGTAEQVQMEAVPVDIDENGPFERAPDLNSQFNLLYTSDGKGDGSDFTGFLMFVKQGALIRTDYTILEPTANRRIELDTINVNDTDVWIYKVDENNNITEKWTRVETLNEQNLHFNDINNTRKKYEVETLENDRIALIFGDGNFSDAPVGNFQLWTRASVNQDLNIPKNRINGQQMGFTYVAQTNVSYEFNMAFSLTAAVQNNASSESIEHIRQAAPSTYYAQNRMVNGQDYNTFMLKDSTILRLKTINRTFAGQPKYIEWNDASKKYENTKLFGDDLILFLDVAANAIQVRNSAKTLIDGYIEPLLQSNSILNTLTHIWATDQDSRGIVTYPRRKFIEDNRLIYKDVNGDYVNPYGKDLNGVKLQEGDGSLNEKTMIQSALDQHWFGEPSAYVMINGTRHGVIPDPILYPKDDGKIYAPDLPRTIDGVNTYPPGDTGSQYQLVAPQKYFGLRFNKFLHGFGTGDIIIYDSSDLTIPPATLVGHTYPVTGIEYYSQRTETITIEMTSDKSTFSVVSNIRGKLPDFSIIPTQSLTDPYPYEDWSSQTIHDIPFNFNIKQGTTEFEAGDGFVVDIKFNNGWKTTVRTFGRNNIRCVNFNGWWELIPAEAISASYDAGGAGIFSTGPDAGPDLVQQMTFDNADVASIFNASVMVPNPNSWVFLVARKDAPTGNVDSWFIYNREMKIIAESPTTKFWYNQDIQILDSDTKKPLFDKIRILRSNLDEMGRPLLRAHIYDVVGFVYDADGVIDFNKIELLPTNSITLSQAGNSTPENLLQFENFTYDSYQYGIYVNGVITWLTCSAPNGTDYVLVWGYDEPRYDSTSYDFYGIIYHGVEYRFEAGNMVGFIPTYTTLGRLNIPTLEAPATIVRRRRVPSIASSIENGNDAYGCNVINGLDFMWQHFSPVTHLIDPSVTNIHDTFIMTRGYYNSMTDYVNGVIDVEPTPPTPLDLRTSYGYLLKNKMLSDTVVLHSGKIKLLFGAKADQRLRATFKVVKSTTATFSDERIKTEIIQVLTTFFDIQNWDFGDKFYATEVIALIHQRLASQISSVVLVPSYSVNSFGSLFTIDSGFDEILQSAATVNDIEIVDALTATVLRQIR